MHSGLGLGLLSRVTIEQELELKRLVVLDIQDFPIMRYWYVVHRKGKRLSAAAEAFRRFVLDKAETPPENSGTPLSREGRRVMRGKRA